MIRSNVASRIVKLEARQRRSDEYLLVWRKPDDEIASAVSASSFQRGDRVICAEWFGEQPLPKPKRYRDRITSALDEDARDYLFRSMQRLTDAEPHRDLALRPPPAMRNSDIAQLSDNELLHAAMGVET